ncbi:hypothetical protein F5876DRAFT_43269 [Lentinula aff. lateritia]|uniref:Uncharacterized protein n=1 Tax=Lentinula aff. lateritia TaxID=2804960 RepID=A0ACC1TY77_9AGAR|nr:hypothetical protein F5876DRAFT_43269 [Lentinula aff. lateritia]
MSLRLAPAIHTLTVSQFKDLHYQHILSHPPDSVLFPFLHGIEGDNEAQNLFFATQGQHAVIYNRRDDNEQPIHPQVNRAPVPKYRGMMWVICEDDLENPDKDLQILVHRPSNLSSYASSEHYEDSSDSYFDDEDELDDTFDDSSSDSFGELMSPDSTTTYTKEPLVRPVSPSQMDLDIQYNDGSGDVDDLHHNTGVVEIVEIGADDKHMHPVQHRALHPLPTPIRTTDLPNSHHSKSPTTTTTTASGFSSSPLTDNGTEPSTALTEPEHSSPPRILGSHHHKHTSSSSRKTPPAPPPPILTSTFRACDLLRPVRGSETFSHSNPHEYTRSGAHHDYDGEWEFVPLHVPEGISLRNFGIQVPILASVSDIIIYSPNATGAAQSANALKLARRFKQAVERKRRERVGCKADNGHGVCNGSHTPLDYNVFLLDANADEIKREMPHLVVKLCPEGEVPGSLGAALAGPSKSNHVSLVKTVPNTVDFAQREKDEMRDLTRASEIVSMFPSGHNLAYLNPDPLHPPVYVQPSSHQIPTSNGDEVDLSNTKTFWNPHVGQIYLGNANDVPLPVNGMGEFGESDPRWDGHDSVDKDVYPPGNSPRHGYGYDICIECHDLAPFPTLAHLKASEEKVAALEQRWRDQIELSRKEKGETQANYSLPPRPPPHPNAIIHLPMPSSPPITAGTMSALMPVVRFLQKCIVPTDAVEIRSQTSSMHSRHTSLSYLASSSHASPFPWSRPLKILIYSADGYTESSVPALCLLMAMKGLSLPHAYLELQVAKRRSFFVYHVDLGVLRKVESFSVSFTRSPFIASSKGGSDSSMGTVTAIPTQQDLASRSVGTGSLKGSATLPMSSSAPSSSMTSLDGIGETSSVSAAGRTRRPRASTSPWLPSLFGGDHQSWFNDPRFDGSFPSRVLPFLYLGNLAHASNVYMLQALGITHVVSVGECALVPPDSHNARGHGPSGNNQGSGHFIPSKSSAHQGSLWIEERAGRIKVLDIQGVCDDGIDTLEPQLEPICDWIDQARQEGGQVLVHCRVGVSRSATVTIAYVMKHLSLPLVDAYLIVRSRRLSVLIQPNMRLLYNLLGWEIKLAKDRAGNDDEKLRKELSCALSWPFLAKEVHALNEKYLR